MPLVLQLLKSRTVEKIVFFLAIFPLSFAIFLDLKTFEPVWTTNAADFWKLRPTIPMPIGTIFFVLYVIYSNVSRLFGNKAYQPLLNSTTRTLTLCLLFPAMGLAWMADLTLPKMIQPFVPMLFFLILYIPSDIQRIRKMAQYALYGVLTFTSLHMVSVIIYAKNFPIVNEHTEFSQFFSGNIYQSLVSYPAMLMLYATFTVWCIIRKFFGKPAHFVLCAALLINICLLVSFSQRRMAVVDLSILCLAVVTIFLTRISILSKIQKGYVIVMLFIMVCCGIVYALDFPLFQHTANRVMSMGGADRIDRIITHLKIISDNPQYLFLGKGGRETGAHNMVLDLIIRFGFLCTLILSVGYFFIFISFFKWKNLRLNSYWRSTDKLFLFILVLQLLANSFFNEALGQPLYFTSWIFLILVVSGASRATHYVPSIKRHRT